MDGRDDGLRLAHKRDGIEAKALAQAGAFGRLDMYSVDISIQVDRLHYLLHKRLRTVIKAAIGHVRSWQSGRSSGR